MSGAKGQTVGTCGFCGLTAPVDANGFCRRCLAVRGAAEEAIRRAQDHRAALWHLAAAGLIVPLGGDALSGPRIVLIRQPDAAEALADLGAGEDAA